MAKRIEVLIEQFDSNSINFKQWTMGELGRLDKMLADGSSEKYRKKIPEDRYPNPKSGEKLFYGPNYAIAVDERYLVNGKCIYPDSLIKEKDLLIREQVLMIKELKSLFGR
jgi:hypothetical protein